jgi:hypothetical protein
MFITRKFREFVLRLGLGVVLFPILVALTQLAWVGVLYLPSLFALPATFFSDILNSWSTSYFVAFVVLTLLVFCLQAFTGRSSRWLLLFSAPLAAWISFTGTNNAFAEQCRFQMSQGTVYGALCHMIGLVPWALCFSFFVFPQPGTSLVKAVARKIGLGSPG